MTKYELIYRLIKANLDQRLLLVVLLIVLAIF